MESDKKWIVLSYIGATLLLAWVLNQCLLLAFRYLPVPNPTLLGVMPASAVVAFAAVSTFAFFYLRQERVNTYVMEVTQELRKVAWPVRRDAYLSTMVVIVAVVFMALVLGIYDWACGRLISFILRV